MNQNLLPQNFIDFISPHIPAHLSLQSFAEYCAKPLRKSIRVNTLKISVDNFIQLANHKNWHLSPVPWCDTGFWLQRPDEEENTIGLGNTAEHVAGLFYIQEASSMLPPEALAFNQTSLSVCLDVAAAPGSKTTQLAAKMNNQGVVVANEFSSSRSKGLFANIQRCGVTNSALTHMDGRQFTYLEETFDAILLDAPCSGEGTIRKDPDAMKNWTEDSVYQIAETQADLIDAAFHALKVGGVMIYSTCTLNPIENQQICLALKQKYPQQVSFEPLNNLFEGAEQSMTADGFLHVWPQIYDSEGFFIARIKKLASIEPHHDNPFTKLGKFPYTPVTKKLAEQFCQTLQNQFACQHFPVEHCYQRNNEIWYFPPEFAKLIGKIKFTRVGVKLAELAKHGFKFDHNLATNFAPLFKQQTFELNSEQAASYLKGQDIWFENDELAKLNKGEVVVLFNQQALGFAKKLPDKLKNQLPRELVRDNVS
ncbi:16S rRNA (cytosine(1407)-C(5))-methyltransferase RsmF [Catenovulum sp. 2E275]|uniref:16S rRNA (cytosine(1407)-C(5))-methyltransferase RsmF n=1 Tax=Catenovulum sp. 2E275 TaxID=2980497 RepID=UPI0021CEB725|nr:16S rRNA (cytosine(1407)-C(5))-methyltransferase RsmF [Catenovulum sp. 2E275]MCU4676801.1 16S rRNA (cytosine(1407)-C(5))-methyltransferase RsmF [Catenovulum sp. 2E275]